jgi:hypothetical protein
VVLKKNFLPSLRQLKQNKQFLFSSPASFSREEKSFCDFEGMVGPLFALEIFCCTEIVQTGELR